MPSGAVHPNRKPGLKLSLWDEITPLGESRGGTPSSVRAPKERAPHPQDAAVVTLRLPAFRFLQFLLRSPDGAKSNPGTMDQRNGRPGFRCAPSGLQGEAGITEERKSGPTPALPWTGPVSQFDVTVFCWRAFARRKNSGAETRRENENVCHESAQQLAQSTPSPRRGEGRGEGVRKIQNKTPPSEPPHPVLLPSGEKGRSVAHALSTSLPSAPKRKTGTG